MVNHFNEWGKKTKYCSRSEPHVIIIFHICKPDVKKPDFTSVNQSVRTLSQTLMTMIQYSRLRYLSFRLLNN